MLICILILGVGSLFVFKNPNGEPWLKTSHFYNPQAISQKFNKTKQSVINSTRSLIDNTKTENAIYKWQDEGGVWHYSDQKKENGKVWIKPDNLTVIPAISTLKNDNKPVKTHKKTSFKAQSSSRVEQVKSLINDTNNVQGIMDNRTNQIDQHLKKTL